MRWEIFYLGDRNVEADVSTRHQHPFLVTPHDPRVSETYQPNSAGFSLVYISENPPQDTNRPVGEGGI